MFHIIKRKKVFLWVLVFILIFSSVGFYFVVKAVSTPNLSPVIVIDAGHGGKDGGAVGEQTNESFLNLQYALALKNICSQFGYKTVLTRKDMNGLYSPFASNKKRSEMEKRKEIIEKSNPDLVISLHMNSFPSDKIRGAQVFYADGSEGGKSLAETIQNRLHQNIDFAKQTAKVGDYYILNCVESPSILVECGFISHPEEEKLLLDQEYCQKFCYNIFCGILKYFKINA